jgi:chondroitin 4-sulfotransferase 11
MLLSNEHKFFFMHIPKTGGTSIRNALNQLIQAPQPYTERDMERKHMSAFLLRDKIYDWDNLWKFTFIRNPYDRMVSYYTFYRMPRKVPYLHSTRKAAIEMSFPEWVRWLKQKEFVRLGDHPPRKIPMWRRPQVDFIYNNGIKLVDHICRYETLEDDYNYIANKLKLNQDPSIWKHHKVLRHDNRSNRLEDFRLYYDDESRSIVKWWFMRDIKEFNYMFF